MTDTPKESAEEFYEQQCKKANMSGNGLLFTPREMFIFSEDYAQSLLSAKLKEQRNLCAEEWNYKHGHKFNDLYDQTVMDEIRNAPEPI